MSRAAVGNGGVQELDRPLSGDAAARGAAAGAMAGATAGAVAGAKAGALAGGSSRSGGWRSGRSRRVVLVGLVCLVVGLVFGVFAGRSWAVFGDRFGLADVNVVGEPTAPAFSGSSAFWAGTCDTGGAPFGSIPGGVGSRPGTVWIAAAGPGEDPLSKPAAEQSKSAPAPVVPDQCVDWGGLWPYGDPGHPGLWHASRTPKWRLAPVTQAGAHPDGSTTMWFRRDLEGFVGGSSDNVYAELPAGFGGDPTAVPKCSAEQFAVKPVQCPPETQVGVLHLYLVAPSIANYAGSVEEVLPVYNLEPRNGRVAEFGIAYVSNEDVATARIVAKARTNGDFGVTAFVSQLPAAVPVIASSVTLWGVPWAKTHDMWRPPQGWRPDATMNSYGEIPVTGLPPIYRVGYERSWGGVRPFVSNPTECSGGELSTRVLLDSYEFPGAFTGEGDPDLSDADWKVYESASPAVSGCEKPPFAPSIDPRPSSSVADSPSGLSVDLSLPQNDDLPFAVPGEGASDAEIDAYVADAEAFWESDQGLGASQLDRAVVSLPEGVSVNPAGAAGLQGCSDVQMGVTDAASSPMLFDNDDPFDGGGQECPAGSRIGTVEVDTPLLEEPLTGDVVLGLPKSTDPESGEMFRLFIVARSVERGLVAKIAGSSIADEQTGRLTATFDKNPRVPFEHMRLDLKGGPRGLLAMPQRCTASPWSALFSPWTAAHGAGGVTVPDSGVFVTDQRCNFGFNPTFSAGMDNYQAAKSGVFTLRFGRSDGEQWFGSVSARLPEGLLASVRDVPLCSNAQANANSCPLGSRIGSVDAGAGSGLPFFLERKGSLFLTEGYKGAPFGLAVSVPVEAGPFRGEFALDTIVVRQALRVDPDTAQAIAVSDPFPRVWHGIPLRVREVTATIDRPGFMRNPTDCSAKQIAATLTSTEGATVARSRFFQADGCRGLAFKPRLRLAFTGKRQTRFGGHPGVKATLTQPAGQANIARATVRLPKAVVLDPDRVADEARICEFEPSKVADCPASSIIGRARAVSPLLKRPLEGPVYFAKNRRINSFGRSIATFPSLVVALRGEIAINLRANSDVKPNKLVSTFPNVPDAPASRFELTLQGGKRGILVVSKDAKTARKLTICGKQIAEIDLDAHNNKTHDTNTRIKTPCKTKHKTKKNKKNKHRRR